MSLHSATLQLARLEKLALDGGRLALQAFERDLALRQQELDAGAQRLVAEHAAIWALPGGPGQLSAFLTGEDARNRVIRGVAEVLERSVEHAQTELQARLKSYKALELAARGMAERAALHQRIEVQAEVAEASAVRAAARCIRTPAPASGAARRAPR